VTVPPLAFAAILIVLLAWYIFGRAVLAAEMLCGANRNVRHISGALLCFAAGLFTFVILAMAVASAVMVPS
jgi:hypothetical protein